MKRFSELLNEVKGEEAHKQAVSMGLKYRGFGYWEDQSGKVAYKTENDQLVPVEGEMVAEKGTGRNRQQQYVDHLNGQNISAFGIGDTLHRVLFGKGQNTSIKNIIKRL